MLVFSLQSDNSLSIVLKVSRSEPRLHSHLLPLKKGYWWEKQGSVFKREWFSKSLYFGTWFVLGGSRNTCTGEDTLADTKSYSN